MFYTYLWLREDGTPYYVGKGKRNRAFDRGSHGVKRPTDRSRILTQEFPSEGDAFEAEKFLIAFYGRKNLGTGCLRNLTDGGEGSVGAIRLPRTKEYRAKLSKSLQGRRFSDSWKHRISLAKKGHKPYSQTEATRKKISQGLTGHKLSDETRKKISETLKRRHRGRLSAM